MKKIMYFLLLTGILFQSCKKPLDEFTSDNQEKIGDVQNRSEIVTKSLEGEIILGEKKANPLTPENMKQAYNNLYDSKITTLQPTHKYVRFLPTFEEFEVLQDMDDLDLIDYPIDREFISDGSFYHDPSIPTNQVTWQYAIVPVGFISPVRNTEILDEIVLVEYDSHWIEEAYQIKGLAYEGTPYGYFDSLKPTITVTSTGAIIPPDDNPIPCPPGCVRKWRPIDDPAPYGPLWESYCDCTTTTDPDPDPVSACNCNPVSNQHLASGSVCVFDTQHGGGSWEGVEGVMVKTWRKNIILGWAFKNKAFTDDNGCWSTRTYKKKRWGKFKDVTIGVKLKFKNKHIVIRGMNDAQDISGYYNPVKEVREVKAIDLRGINFSYGEAGGGNTASKRYHAATAMNAFFEYNDFASQDGITQIDKIDVLLHPFDLGGASAPMLDQINGNLLSELGQAYGMAQVMNAVTKSSLGTIVFPAIAVGWVFAPDITYPIASGSTSSDQIKETFFHEYAHASHFFKVGENYWKDNIQYVVVNNGYGTTAAPGSGRTAVIEMWGFHYGPTLADRLYGTMHSNSVSAGLDINQARHINLLERRMFIASFIPAGLVHDLIDNNSSPILGSVENSAVITTDIISGFSHSLFFNRLNSSVLSPTQLRTPLSSVAPSGVTTSQINSLFGSYGF